MIQDQSKSNSERGKDKKTFFLNEKAGLTLLLGMTRSFEDCDWFDVQEGNKRVLLESIISLHLEMTCIIFPVLPYSLSHTHYVYVYIYTYFICIYIYIYIYIHTCYLPCGHT